MIPTCGYATLSCLDRKIFRTYQMKVSPEKHRTLTDSVSTFLLMTSERTSSYICSSVRKLMVVVIGQN